MKLRKNKKIIIIFLCFIILFLLFIFKIRDEMTDFEVCYRAGKRVLLKENLYQMADGHEQFKYLPFSAFVFVPFAILPLTVAKGIWYFLVLISYFLCLYISYLLISEKRKKTSIIISITFLILLKFYGRELQLGQINCLIILLLFLMLYFLLKNKEKSTAFVWALALPIKLYALIFLPYFIIKKRFKIVLWGFLFSLIILFSPSLIYGIKGNFELLNNWEKNLSLTTPSLMGVYDNASLYALFIKWFNEKKNLIYVLTFSLIILLSFLFLYLFRRGKLNNIKSPEVLEGAILLIFIPLFSPLGWYYNYLYSLLGIMILINYFDKFSPGMRFFLVINLFLIGGSLYEILGRELFRLYTRFSIVTINYLIVIYCLSYLRLKKPKGIL